MVLRKEGAHVVHEQLRLLQRSKVSCAPADEPSQQCLIIACHPQYQQPMNVAAGIRGSHSLHAETTCQINQDTLLSTAQAVAAPPAGMTVQRLRLYCLATHDLGYVQISLGNTAIAVGACMQQLGCQCLAARSCAQWLDSICTKEARWGSR